MKKEQRIIVIVLATLFLVLTILVQKGLIVSIDNALYERLMVFQGLPMDTFMKSITILGNTIPVLCIACFIMIFLNKKERYLFGTNIIITVLSNQIIKRIIKRPRPNHLRLIKQGGYSYPSGHAMIAIGLYGLLLYFVNKKIKDKKQRIFFSSLLTFIMIGIGISRVYVGVHYPSDIIAGYLLSSLILICEISYWHHHRGKLK